MAPVMALRVTEFPMLIAAQAVKFGYRGNKRGYRGSLRSVVMTLVRPLRPDESVAPGHVLWLLPSDKDDQASSRTGVVTVRGSPTSATLLTVEMPDGSRFDVPLSQVRRFYECVVRCAQVHLEMV